MKATVIPRAELPSPTRAQMFALMNNNFRGVDNYVFENDLANKDYVIVLSREQRVCGFTTLALSRVVVDQEPINVIYSGDTIMDRAAWGTLELPKAWIDWVATARRRLNGERLLWLLICSGVRTYRFLSVFFREFYPTYKKNTPAQVGKLLRLLAEHRYGKGFDPATGIVRLHHPQVLREDLHCAPVRLMSDPHAAFFAHANPGYVGGDELACIADLSDSNLTLAGRRMLKDP